MNELAPRPSQSCHPIPNGHVSLWEMINYNVSFLVTHLKIIELDVRMLRLPSSTNQDAKNALVAIALAGTTSGLTEDEKVRVRGCLGATRQLTKVFESHVLDNLIDEAERHVGWNNRDDVANQLEAIAKTIEIEARNQFFYHCPRHMGQRIKDVDEEWKQVLSAFQSTKYDIVQGIDCYACDHNTAAVFHMMRVAECGLIQLASERKVKLKKGKPLSHGQWGEIVEEVEKAATQILRTAKPGDVKDEALSFYNGAASHVRALKDKYRNVVMHSRRNFNKHEAADAIHHTKSFMVGLSERINERDSKTIRWKF